MVRKAYPGMWRALKPGYGFITATPLEGKKLSFALIDILLSKNLLIFRRTVYNYLPGDGQGKRGVRIRMISMIIFYGQNCKKKYQINTLVLNLDNGPDNSSRRTQFLKRIVDFAYNNALHVKLAYYPPYHSKYNPIERVWGRLENHWTGELLDSEEKVLGLASTMSWKGNMPTIEMVERKYDSGVKLTKDEMQHYEQRILRHPKLGKYFVDINPACA